MNDNASTPDRDRQTPSTRTRIAWSLAVLSVGALAWSLVASRRVVRRMEAERAILRAEREDAVAAALASEIETHVLKFGRYSERAWSTNRRDELRKIAVLLRRATTGANASLFRELRHEIRLQAALHELCWVTEQEPLALLHEPSREVTSIAITDDGSRVLTGSDRGAARLWDVRTGAVLRVFRDAGTQHFPSDRVAVALSGDGSLAVTAWASEVQLWNANTGALVRSIAGPQRGTPIIALSKTSEHLFVTGRDEAVVQVWDVRTGASLRTLVGHRGAVTALAVMGDSTIASAGVDRTVRVWNARTGELRHVLPQRDAVHSISLIEERDELLVSLDAGGIVRFRAISQNSLPFPVEFQEFGNLVAFDTVAPLGDGRTLIALERATARLNLWDYDLFRNRYTLRTTLSASRPVAASRDGSRIVAATTSAADSDATRAVGVWSGRVGGLPQGYNPFGDEAFGFLPDGVRVFVHHRGALWVWNTHNNRIERRCERGREDGAASRTSSSRLSVYADESRVLRGADVIDTRTCALVWRLPVAGDFTASALFSGDSLIVTGASTGIAQLWDARTGALLRSFEGHRDQINAVAGSPDGSRILTASADQTSRLWNARTGELLQTIVPGRRAFTAAFANNDLFFVAGRDEHEVESRDVRSGRVVRVFRGPATEWPSQVFALGDGSRVLIGGFARIWQTHTATPFEHTFYSPREPNSVAPDGSRFVDRGLVVPLTIAAWIEHVCLRIASSDLWMEPTMRDVRGWCSDRASAAIGANRSPHQAMAADAGPERSASVDAEILRR